MISVLMTVLLVTPAMRKSKKRRMRVKMGSRRRRMCRRKRSARRRRKAMRRRGSFL